MSQRPTITANTNKPLINAQSMAASFNGPATNINGIPGISYDLVWTGTPTGTFQVQVCNTHVQDNNGNTITEGNWQTLPASSFTGTYPAPAGNDGNGFLDVIGTEAAWVRLQYTQVSGTGALTVIPAAKVL